MAHGASIALGALARRLSRGARRGKRPKGKKRGSAFFSPGRDRTSGFYGFGTREAKFFDSTQSTSPVPTAGVVLDSINEIPQGTTEKNRIGRRCTVLLVDLHVQLKLPATTTVGDADDIVRFILFCDKQCNGATAAVADILETGNYRAHYNLANINRFKILHDKTYKVIAPNGGVGSTPNWQSGPDIRYFKILKRLHLPIEFDSTTGAITEIRSNNIGVLVISESAVAALTGTYRLRFVG